MNTAEIFIENQSGFFNGDTPTHNDVEEYFTEKNFEKMFGEAQLPENLSFESLRKAAHEMLDIKANA